MVLSLILSLLFCFREYLATFKKTVAMHEVFLTRLAAHPTLRKDSNFNVFLEFKGDVSLQENWVIPSKDLQYQKINCHSLIQIILFLMQLNVRSKNKKERLGGLFKGLAKGVDEVLLSGQKVSNWLNNKWLFVIS